MDQSECDVLVDDRRLPEEKPETPWDVSSGLRMAYSAILAEREERIELSGGIDTQREESPPDIEEMTRANRWGQLALLAAAGSTVEGGTLEEQLKAVRDGFMTRDFVERLAALAITRFPGSE